MKCSDFNRDHFKALPDMTPADWPCLESVFKRYLELGNCHPITIEKEGKSVAVGSSILLEKSAWIGHVIVHPEYQRQGLGRTIMKELLGLIQSRGINTVSLLATDMGYPLYQSLGFELQQEYCLYSVPEKLNLEYSSDIETLTEKNRADILQLDHRISGENRSVFLESSLKDAVGLRQGSSLTAFFLPHAGEGVILAENPGEGLELLKYKMTRFPHKRVSFPVKNRDAQDFCISSGCTEIRHPRRMILGPSFPWIPEMVYSRFGGFIG